MSRHAGPDQLEANLLMFIAFMESSYIQKSNFILQPFCEIL